MSSPERDAVARAHITELLRAASSGDAASRSRLLTEIAAELRSLAAREAARWRGANAWPTALVNELYLRLFGSSSRSSDWPNRRYFFAAAARALHEIMIEQQRRMSARQPPRSLPAECTLTAAKDDVPVDLIDLRLALETLERIDARAAEVFRLRHLLEMTIEEVARALSVSHGTVERDDRYARAWLRSKLDGAPSARRGAGTGSASGTSAGTRP